MDDVKKSKLKKVSEHGIQAPLALLAELSHRCPCNVRIVQTQYNLKKQENYQPMSGNL